MSAIARVEIYAAEWYDERFDRAWGVLDPLHHTFSTDGDVCTIACSSDDPVGEGWAVRQLYPPPLEPRTISTDDAPVLGVEVVDFTGSGWGVWVEDADGVWHDA
ncbi:MAG: hypothetical protein DRJ56_07150, partial [Thermoprotei archaeon]